MKMMLVGLGKQLENITRTISPGVTREVCSPSVAHAENLGILLNLQQLLDDHISGKIGFFCLDLARTLKTFLWDAALATLRSLPPSEPCTTEFMAPAFTDRKYSDSLSLPTSA